jgi:hypothetical protein
MRLSAFKGSLTLVIVQLICASQLVAQSTGNLRLLMEPAGLTRYVLDGKHRMDQRDLELIEGTHRFVFWAPERRMLDTVINVIPGVMQDVRVTLRYSEEYMKYRSQADRFNTTQRWAKVAPPLVAGAALAWTAVSLFDLRGRDRDLDELEQRYVDLADPQQIADLKGSAIPEAKEAFRSARTRTLVAGGLAVVASGATVYFWQRIRHKGPPVFEDKEKVRFDGLVWQPDGSGNGSVGISFTLALQ